MNADGTVINRIPVLLSMLILGILVLVSFAGGVPDARRGAQPLVSPEPALQAQAYLVRFAGERNPVMERRGWKRMAPASLTKLLTAILAEEEIGPDEKITFVPEAKQVEEKTSDAAAGEAFFRNDVMRFLLMASDNDAALALAAAVGEKLGGYSFEEKIGKFVDLMNEKIRALALGDTQVRNPVGFDADGHYASAENLSAMAEYALKRHPDLWEISRTAETMVYSLSNAPHIIKTTDDLLYEFPGIIGSKTGFTDRARGALMLLYPVQSRGTAIIVILGSDDRFEDGRKIINWLDQNF